MLQLNYYAHKLLNNKHKIFINLIFYIGILFIYNLTLQEFHVVECMKRAMPAVTPESDTDYMRFLENENKILKDQIETQQLNIAYFEENQKYLMDKVSILQAQI